VLLYLERDVFSSVQLAHILPAVASIDPCAQQQKLVKLVLPVENLMYSSVNLDGGYMKRSFVCSQWFLLSSETTYCQQGNYFKAGFQLARKIPIGLSVSTIKNAT
jgi:hypothetical protein